MSDRNDNQTTVNFRCNEELKDEFKNNVPNMTEALRQVMYSYVEDADTSLEQRIYSTRRSILRMHKTRLETEIEQMQSLLDEINEVLGEVDEDPQVIHKVDMSALYDDRDSRKRRNRHTTDDLDNE